MLKIRMLLKISRKINYFPEKLMVKSVKLKLPENSGIYLPNSEDFFMMHLPEFPGHIFHLNLAQVPLISLKIDAKNLSHSQIFIFTNSLKFLGHSTCILVLNYFITLCSYISTIFTVFLYIISIKIEQN
jgi:hypothetical protein